MELNYLQGIIKQFEYYKLLAEKTFDQVREQELFWQFNAESNSIAVIVKHLWGNMLSRWTDFLTTDGEKPWRNRDAEFENDISNRKELLQKWEEGWSVFLTTLRSLKPEDLENTVYIRNQGHSVVDAINRQLAHYSYHIGQIVFIGKMCAVNWKSLSIPKGNSSLFNTEKFKQPPHSEHFTDEFLYTNNTKKTMMITENDASKFVHEWIESFNAHNIHSILEHYADEIEFYSPFIPLLNFNDEGVLSGKTELKKYFEAGLNAYPDLHFKLHNYFIGINTVVIYYTSVNGRFAAETFQLNQEGKAVRVFCNYNNTNSVY